METKMTVYEIYLAICVETVDIWDNPRKRRFVAYSNLLDDYNAILEPHAFANTFPNEGEWQRVISGLTYLLNPGLEIDAILERAKELAAHPEFFDAELNEQQRRNYDKHWDKSCIEYHTNGKM